MLFNKKLTATLLAALILTSATNADAMGWNFTTGWKKWALFGAVATVAALVITKMWATLNTNTELITAAARGDLAQVQALVAADVDVNAPDEFGCTALRWAARYGRTDIAQLLINARANIDAQDIYGYTALITAALNGHTAIVRALIHAGANINAQTRDGWTALSCAVRSGRTGIVQDLICAGATVTTEDALVERALMWAARHGYTETVQALIAAGANINAQTRDGWTVLMEAEIYGHTHIVQLLISHGADVNARTQDGNTALMCAARHGHTQIVQLLISHGADVNAQTRDGWTALSFASRHTNRNIFNLLTQEQNRVSTPLHQACSHGIGSENIELILRDEHKRRAIETMYTDLNNLPAGTITDDIQGEMAQLNTVNTNGFTARHYLQTRAWMMQPITITIRFLNGDTLTLNCTRGTQIHAVKRLIAQHISTPEHTVNTSMITLTRKNNNAEATDYEVAGITNEFYVIINNPNRAAAGPANA